MLPGATSSGIASSGLHSKSQRAGYPEPKPYASTYAIRTEANIEAVVYRIYQENHYSRPAADSLCAILYVAHHSSDNELRHEPLIGDLLSAESAS